MISTNKLLEEKEKMAEGGGFGERQIPKKDTEIFDGSKEGGRLKKKKTISIENNECI